MSVENRYIASDATFRYARPEGQLDLGEQLYMADDGEISTEPTDTLLGWVVGIEDATVLVYMPPLGTVSHPGPTATPEEILQSTVEHFVDAMNALVDAANEAAKRLLDAVAAMAEDREGAE